MSPSKPYILKVTGAPFGSLCSDDILPVAGLSAPLISLQPSPAMKLQVALNFPRAVLVWLLSAQFGCLCIGWPLIQEVCLAVLPPPLLRHMGHL